MTTRLQIGSHWIGSSDPTYFIADISANHDGSLERAKLLIRLAKEAGADAAKFQHFRAPYIVSARGFEQMGKQVSHQARWRKSIFEVYQAASVPWEWTAPLCDYSKQIGIDFFSAPYDLEAVDMLDPYVPAYKIGSGDITWPEILEKIASKQKPVILATGASSIEDVDRAVRLIERINPRLAILQCNTNYTGSEDNFDHMQLNVLKEYQTRYPNAVLGLSDHTSGHACVLGAVALGGRVIEKHFTDDNAREGPDHPFSMTPATWQAMVQNTRHLERALGSSKKTVCENERETVVIQRRCLRAAKDLPAGTRLKRSDIDILRPASPDGIYPYELDKVLGKSLRAKLQLGDHLSWSMLDPE